MSERLYSWTRGGLRLYLEPLNIGELPSIGTIAESLAGQTRWTGHAGIGYTVADHSLAVSRCAIQMVHRLPEYPYSWQFVGLTALLHDAHETVLGDVNTNVKRALYASGCYELKRLANNFDRLLDVRENLGGLLCPLLDLIDRADKAVAQAEAELLPIAVPADVAREAFGFNGDALTIAKVAVEHVLWGAVAGQSPAIPASERFLAQYEELRGRL